MTTAKAVPATPDYLKFADMLSVRPEDMSNHVIVRDSREGGLLRGGSPMWTAKNRGRYDRSKLRYPSDLTDDEWGACRTVD